jgi:vacuolar-type H+-ATPase subunit F/Vma7
VYIGKEKIMEKIKLRYDGFSDEYELPLPIIIPENDQKKLNFMKEKISLVNSIGIVTEIKEDEATILIVESELAEEYFKKISNNKENFFVSVIGYQTIIEHEEKEKNSETFNLACFTLLEEKS